MPGHPDYQHCARLSEMRGSSPRMTAMEGIHRTT
jgi:hypothetical protein